MSAVHMVGSVTLPDTQSVFRLASEHIGDDLKRIPDGEVGRPYTEWFMPVIVGHPAVTMEPGGVMAVLPRLRIAPDAAGSLEFDELGIGRAAIASYATFAELKDEGVIGPRTRFQAGLSTPLSLAVPLGDGADQMVLYDAFMKAMLREIAIMVEGIPHDQLAIQIEMPGEIGILEDVFPAWFGTDLAPIVEQFQRLAAAVPQDVDLGVHLCYGDPPPAEGERGQHWADPKDMGVLVTLANAVIGGAGRPIAFLHMPVPIERDDVAYFRPLSELRLPQDTELFLGLVHDRDGLEGSKRRIAAARQVRADFGVGTECGMGRLPGDLIPDLLRLHRQTADLAG